MVKTAFPVDINADKATYEIQFGTLERPTHFNTSWDKAKFEVCAQKYADLSEGEYGVAILNDCKYGHDIHGGTIQLSLFRSPTDPWEDADQGKIEFTYSLMPHEGTFVRSDVQREAYYLNYPMHAVPTLGSESSIPENYSLVSINRENVICETVKEAETGQDTVMRLYESKNMKCEADITVGFDAKKCFLCDMLEQETEELPIKNGCVKVPFKAFEIVTLKFKM
jgi:alpha-mannosidase